MSDTLTATLPTREVTLAWSDALSLELDFMDDTHREFVDLLAATELADDETLTERFAALIEHTEDHFGGEDKWMKDTKFSSSNCHTMQHNVILEVMREGLRRGREKGDMAVMRQMAHELGIWFPQHAKPWTPLWHCTCAVWVTTLRLASSQRLMHCLKTRFTAAVAVVMAARLLN